MSETQEQVSTKEKAASPLFDFSDSLDGVDFDTLQEEIDKDSKRGRFIDEPGIYTLKVDRVEVIELDTPIPNWAAFKVYLRDTNGRETNEFLFVPMTCDIKYPTSSGKNQLWAIIKLQKFALSLGIDMQGRQIFVAIKKMFKSDTAIVGRTGRFRLDYETSNHAEPIGDGWALVLSGKTVMQKDDPSEVEVFPKKQDAGIYCKDIAKKKFSGFLSIVECLAGEVVEKTEKSGKILGM
jgi:hypothetical protein